MNEIQSAIVAASGVTIPGPLCHGRIKSKSGSCIGVVFFYNEFEVKFTDEVTYDAIKMVCYRVSKDTMEANRITIYNGINHIANLYVAAMAEKKWYSDMVEITFLFERYVEECNFLLSRFVKLGLSEKRVSDILVSDTEYANTRQKFENKRNGCCVFTVVSGIVWVPLWLLSQPLMIVWMCASLPNSNSTVRKYLDRDEYERNFWKHPLV